MGILLGLIGLTIKCIIFTLVIFAAFIYTPFFLDFNPQNFRIPLTRDFEGPLKPNNFLSNAQHMFKGEILGPESIVSCKGDLYTGLEGGRVVRIRNGQMQTIAQMTSYGQCGKGLREAHKCGRPLGIRCDSKGNLYLVDAYLGLKKIDILGRQGSVKTLLSTNRVVDGNSSKFFDDLVVDEGAGSMGGNVYYITDVGSKWPLDYVLFIVMEHDHGGRIIKYDEDSNTATVLTSGYSFPNGIEINDAKDAILFAEFSKRRIMKTYINGPKIGKTEIFIDHLPGEPDNIRRASDPKKETYWIGLAFGRNRANFLDKLSDKALVRKGLIKIIYLIGYAIESVGNLFNYLPLKEIGFHVKCGFVMMSLNIKDIYGMVMEVNSKGEILRSLHSPDAKTVFTSEVREVVEDKKKVLYLGSFSNDYLGRLEL